MSRQRTAKPVAPAAKEETLMAMPPKNRMTLFFTVILFLLLLVVGGAVWLFAKNYVPAETHAEAAQAEAPNTVKFISLGDNFTVNLQREEGSDRDLQVGITLKVMQPQLEEKIKVMMPEIRSRLLFLLSSKKPSELLTAEGKKKLIGELITETDAVLGLGVPAAIVPAPAYEAGFGSAVSNAASAPVATSQMTPATVAGNTGNLDVLFTSFFVK